MSGEIYYPLIHGMKWSHSRIDCYDFCRYKWFLRYIDDPEGNNAKQMFYSSYGSYIHSLIERYYKGEIKKDDLPLEYLAGFSENVRGERPSESIFKSYLNSGLKYFENFEPFPYNMVDVEMRVDFTIGEYNFVGIIDYLGEKDGEYYIIDNKSRDLKPRSKRKKPTKKDEELDEMLKQLYLYAEAVKQMYGKYPKSLCFNCFKTGTFIEEPFREDRLKEAIDWAINTIQKIEASEGDSFYPNIDYFPCRFLCEYNHECCYHETGRKR